MKMVTKLLSKWNVARKLAAMGAIGVIGLTAIGAFSFSRFGLLSTEVESQTVAASALRNHLEGDMMHDALKGDVLNALLARTEADRDAVRKDVEEHSAIFDAALTRNKQLPLAASARAVIAAIEAPLQQYIAAAKAQVDLGLQDVTKAQAALPAFLEKFSTLEVAQGNASDVIQKSVDATVATTREGVSSDRKTVVIGTGVVALALLAMSWLVAKSIRSSISTSSAGIGAASTQLMGVASSMSLGADSTAAQASQLSASSEQIGANAVTVAAALEEMQATISEITRAAFEASSTATAAVNITRETQTIIAGLGESSAEIGKVVEAISSIAEDTNMLALNATIEAARAGDSGKGFAVVASEVKELANETAAATQNIKSTIARIQSETGTAIDAIERVATIIDRINEGQEMIAAAVEEQGATTSEMVRSISEVAYGINEMSSSVNSVVENAHGTAEGAAATLASATDLSELADSLRRS